MTEKKCYGEIVALPSFVERDRDFAFDETLEQNRKTFRLSHSLATARSDGKENYCLACMMIGMYDQSP